MLLQTLAKHWWVLLVRGILAVLFPPRDPEPGAILARLREPGR